MLMICKECRRAGKLLMDNRENNDSAVIKLIRSVHALCTGCACQHKIGKVLRTQSEN